MPQTLDDFLVLFVALVALGAWVAAAVGIARLI